MKSWFLTLSQSVSVPFKATEIYLSPQKSAESVVKVLVIEIVSLKVYFSRLVVLKPAKLTKFSI